MKKNVLLTGASGTVGLEVLKQLIDKDDFNVTVFDIKTKRTSKIFRSLPQKFNLIYGDIADKEDVDKATKNIDAVIHLAAIIPPLADDQPQLAEKVNVIGTQNLIRSLQKNSPEAFFIYSSSISVYGDRIENPDIKVDDDIAPSMGDEYAVTKIKAEKAIQNSGLRWTVFRLAAIMGNHKISKLMFHMPLDTPMEICTPGDTGRAFVNALEHEAELNHKIFNLGGGESCRISYRDFLAKSFEIFGMGRVNFPEKAFAEKNFHCGNYADGDDLERILHFRRDTLEDYFQKVAESVKPGMKFITKMVNPAVKRSLLKKSEPYEAFRKNDRELSERFFKN